MARGHSWGLLLGLGSALLAFSGCTTETSTGEMIVAVQTDVKIPQDIDRVEVEILVDGFVRFGRGYDVGPGALKIPATLGLLPGSRAGAPTTVRLIARKGGKARILREVVTTIPTTRIALLRVPLQWLCDNTAVEDAAGHVTSTCGEGKTCVSGGCVASTVDSATLPDFVSSGDVFGGGDGSGNGACFDTIKCHGSVADAPVDLATCTVPMPQGGAVPNVFLRTQPRGDGICSADESLCLVPLDANVAEGWVPTAGHAPRIQLPRIVCDTLLPKGTLAGVAVSTACGPKTPSLPTCGAWSSSGNGDMGTLDGGAPPDVDVRPPDSGPPPERLVLVSGDPQDSFPVTTLDAPLIVKLTDGSGTPLPGRPITWAITSTGGGVVTPASPTTASDGTASATAKTGGNDLTITASVPGTLGSPITFHATARPLLPAPASAAAWQWQGQQKKFTSGGLACNGRVALSVGYQRVCFTDTTDALQCAGALQGTLTWGSSFVPAGISGVDQILAPVAGTSYTVVHTTNGGTSWIGTDADPTPVFGTPSALTFTPWVSNVVALGQSSHSLLCFLDTAGAVSCAGLGYGSPPVVESVGPHTSFFIENGEGVSFDNVTTFRSGEVGGSGTITASGFVLGGTPLGTPGSVVSGQTIRTFPDAQSGSCSVTSACWLESSGTVSCRSCETGSSTAIIKTVFAPGKVIAFSTFYYTNDICAVYQDGSLWCAGDNGGGMLGAGDLFKHPVPVMVKPPGSVQIECK